MAPRQGGRPRFRGPLPEAVLREARARQRRRRGRLAATCVGSLIAVGFVAGDGGASRLASGAGGSGGSGGPLANAASGSLSGYVVFEPGGGGPSAVSGPGAVPASISVINAATGTSTTRRLVTAFSTSYPWVAVGNTVVAVDDTQTMTADRLTRPEIGTAYAFRPSGTAPPVALGAASGAVAAADGGVWLLTDSITPLERIDRQANAATCTVREVSLTGAALSATYPIPCSMTPLEGTPEGLLTQTYVAGSVNVEIWNPATQAVVRTLAGLASPISGEGSTFTTPLANARFGIEVGEHDFGPCGPTQCPLSAVDLADGTTHPFPVPAGDEVWTPISMAPGHSDRLALIGFSPSEYQRYARILYKAEHTTGSPPDISFPATLMVSDVATGATLSKRPVTIDFGEPLVWSPDAGYLFVIGDATHVTAYPATSTRPGRKLVIHQAVSMLVTQR